MWWYVRFGLMVCFSGVIMTAGVLMCLTFILWPVGVVLMFIAGALPGRMYVKKIVRDMDAIRAHDNNALIDGSFEMEEDELPWNE